jgi:hypothetical protein
MTMTHQQAAFQRLLDEWFDYLATQGFPAFWRGSVPVSVAMKQELLATLRGFCRGATVLAEWVHLDNGLPDTGRYEWSDEVEHFRDRAARQIERLETTNGNKL